jgi:hypothetical protein
MSIFSKIFDRIRNHGQASGPQQTGTATSTAQAGQNAGQAPQAQANQSAPSQAGPAAGPSVGGAQQGATQAQPVDVEAVLTSMAGKNPQKLNWRTSIVDLMKLVGMDSTLAERKELADELGYTGDKNDTAAMNIWLHKQVMAKMAANGGKVPASMLD